MPATPTRLVVDLNAYAHNLQAVQGMLPEGCAIMAVVKADAYGLGAGPVARRAEAEGVRMLGVASVAEGIALRAAGVRLPILVLTQVPRDALQSAVENDLRLTLSDVDTATHLAEHAKRLRKVVPIHCKIDTGMGRQGFNFNTAISDLLHLTRISHIDIEGLCTHFSTADEPDNTYTISQLRAFRQFLKQVEREGIPYEIVHAANSAAIVTTPSAAFDMVRPGLMTYGIWPTSSPPAYNNPLRPVVRWESQITLLRHIEAGTAVGYGRRYTPKAPMRAAIVPVGYADGYPYQLSNKAEVLIHGRRCCVRGAVSMDQIVVDVTDVPNAVVGDPVVLAGRDGTAEITIAELAEKAQTIPYVILTGIGNRVARVYVA